MGLFEIGAFSNGTINVAKSMALAFWRFEDSNWRGGHTRSDETGWSYRK